MSTAQELVRDVVANAKRYTPPLTGFARFNLTDKVEEMRRKLKDQVDVLPHLALLGQWTTFYAAPNTGKTLLTLWLLRESIRAGNINGQRVLYINCDDHRRGLVEKIDFAREAGFCMATEGEGGFRSSMLLPEMQRAVRDGDANGQVLVLDTLKKFIGLMDKAKQTEANKVIRTFVMAGGTIIALAHVNKHRGDDGELVYQGTTDAVDDADCAYTMDVVERHESRSVTFVNLKQRGDVAIKYGLEYRAAGSWRDRLESVCTMDDAQMADAAKAERVAAMLERDQRLIDAALAAIAAGKTRRTELRDAIREETGASKSAVLKMLDAHAGKRWRDGHRWTASNPERNVTEYAALLPPPQWVQN